VSDSPEESARFGFRIGRLNLDDHPIDVGSLHQALDRCHHDVVIVRHDATLAGTFAELVLLDDFDAIFADCLMYWHVDLDADVDPDNDLAMTVCTDVAALESMARHTFDDYRGHYAANPLFDAAAAADGYGEWARRMVDSGEAMAFTVDNEGHHAGFAIVDVSTDIADIRLAGVLPAHQRRGVYRRLLRATMQHFAALGHQTLTISTQANNTKAMATWAKLGWWPTHSIVTTHLVRRGLLDQARHQTAHHDV